MVDEELDAFEMLLAAWRVGRHADLGRAIEEISQERLKDSKLEEILDALPTKLKESVERLDSIAFWPPDPRIGSAIFTMLKAPPFRGTSRFYRLLFEILPSHLDQRSPDRFSEAQEAWEELTNNILARDLAERARPWLEETGAQRTLSTPEKRHCKTIIRALRQGEFDGNARNAVSALSRALGSPKIVHAEAHRRRRDEKKRHEFLRAIAADPENDEPRLVFADWLLERGEPQGEFILLQLKEAEEGLSRHERQHMSGLIEQHHRDWLGNLQHVLLHPDKETKLVFRRGLLDECELPGHYGSRKWGREVLLSMGDPRWGTVRTIRNCGGKEQVALVNDPCLSNLRELTNVLEWSAFQQLSLGPPRSLRSLGLNCPIVLDGPDMNQIAQGPGLPELRELHVTIEAGYYWRDLLIGGAEPSCLPLLAGPLGQRLTEATFPCAPNALGDWYRCLAAFPDASLQKLRLNITDVNTPQRSQYRATVFLLDIVRSSDGSWPTLLIQCTSHPQLNKRLIQRVIGLLDSCPPGVPSQLQIANTLTAPQLMINAAKQRGVELHFSKKNAPRQKKKRSKLPP